MTISRRTRNDGWLSRHQGGQGRSQAVDVGGRSQVSEAFRLLRRHVPERANHSASCSHLPGVHPEPVMRLWCFDRRADSRQGRNPLQNCHLRILEPINSDG
jgi:hypothetical protein